MKSPKLQSSKLQSFVVFYQNSEEYHHLKAEVFTQGSYYFETTNPRPVIIDAGAHIGLSTLYFKRLFPDAKVFSIEPNLYTFTLLEKNVFENQLEDIHTLHSALSDTTGTQDFYIDDSSHEWFSTAGFHPQAWNRTQTTRATRVSTILLSELLIQIGEPVDFMKMDIEGAEQKVLMEAGVALRKIRQMIIEFHPLPEQSLPNLIKFLGDLDFAIQLWKGGREVDLKHAKGLVYIQATQK